MGGFKIFPTDLERETRSRLLVVSRGRYSLYLAAERSLFLAICLSLMKTMMIALEYRVCHGFVLLFSTMPRLK